MPGLVVTRHFTISISWNYLPLMSNHHRAKGQLFLDMHIQNAVHGAYLAKPEAQMFKYCNRLHFFFLTVSGNNLDTDSHWL